MDETHVIYMAVTEDHIVGSSKASLTWPSSAMGLLDRQGHKTLTKKTPPASDLPVQPAVTVAERGNVPFAGTKLCVTSCQFLTANPREVLSSE